MYNVYVKAEASLKKVRPRTNKFEFELGKKKFTLTEEHICFGVESVKAACMVSSSSSSSESLCSYELSFSCLYSRALDRFLFQDATKGACLHQTPSRVRQNEKNNTVEKVDIYALPFLANFQPDGPILVADVKNSMFDAADKESLLYAMLLTVYLDNVAKSIGPCNSAFQGPENYRNSRYIMFQLIGDCGDCRLPSVCLTILPFFAHSM